MNLKTLKTVNLSHNKLKEFPLFLCQLIHVDFVNLSANQITSIPHGIDVISAVEINLNQNQITVLPESLARCKRLKVLRVEENCIASGGLPPAILRDSTISLICIEGNVMSMQEFKDLPDYETVLFMSHVQKSNFSLCIVYGEILCFKKKTRLTSTATYKDYAVELMCM